MDAEWLAGVPFWLSASLGILEFVLLVGALVSAIAALICWLLAIWGHTWPWAARLVTCWRVRWIIHRARPSRRRHPMERII